MPIIMSCNNCSSSLWFYLRSLVIAVLLVVVSPARPRPTARLPQRSNCKPEAATAVIELLMAGMRMPETCWDVFKQQVINLWNWCICLVDSFECMMMHGLANPKFKGICLREGQLYQFLVFHFITLHYNSLIQAVNFIVPMQDRNLLKPCLFQSTAVLSSNTLHYD